MKNFKYRITINDNTSQVHLCFGGVHCINFYKGEAVAELNDSDVEYLQRHGYSVELIKEEGNEEADK
ncbi:MAG: hypothetical protein NC177_17700 [Ruminococcus flavefaciens]|nr:hypothetical protein [Ruminococcus flavefaciens]